MPETLTLFWTIILAAAPLVGAVALFAVHVLQVRNLQTQTRTLEAQSENLRAQNLKLREELLKLQSERQDRESVIQVADFGQTERFAPRFQSSGDRASIIGSVAAVLFLSSYALLGLEALDKPGRPSSTNSSSSAAAVEAQLADERAKVERLEREATELRRRLDEQQSKDIRQLAPGDVRVTLRWNNAADVDLYVIDPTGEEISYQHPQSRSRGRLDRDETRGFGPESIFWPANAAPKGKYRVFVELYAGEPATYSVDVRVGTRHLSRTGDLTRLKPRVLVAEFDVP